MGILLRDIFPDPDAVCKQLRLYQNDTVSWFTELILSSARNTELDGVKAKEAQTREELMRCIRYRNENGTRSNIPPASIQLIENLLGDWPSITNGGCRFHLQSRIEFISQYKVISNSGLTWNNGWTMKTLDDDDKYYLLFSINPVDLVGVKWTGGVDQTGLVYSGSRITRNMFWILIHRSLLITWLLPRSV